MPSDKQGNFSGVYSDGQTAAAHDVTLLFDEIGLKIRSQDAGINEVWFYDEIRSAQPLSPGEPAHISLSSASSGHLYVQNVEFAAELLRHAPQLSKRAEGRRVLVPMFAIVAVAGLIAAIIWIFDISVARGIAGLMPDKMRQGFGDQVAHALVGGKKICDNKPGQKALNKIMARLGQGVPSGRAFDVQVADLSIMNAFAAPGERIVVSGKLIKFVKTPEELAGVLAHEMGHGLELHPETGIVRALGISATLNLLLGGSAGTLGEIGGFLLQLKYTRDAERAADAHAIAIMKKVELSPKPLAEFFARLQKKSPFGKSKITKKTVRDDDSSNVFDLLSTHPSLPERVKTIKSLKNWKTRQLLTSAEWEALREICKTSSDKAS